MESEKNIGIDLTDREVDALRRTLGSLPATAISEEDREAIGHVRVSLASAISRAEIDERIQSRAALKQWKLRVGLPWTGEELDCEKFDLWDRDGLKICRVNTRADCLLIAMAPALAIDALALVLALEERKVGKEWPAVDGLIERMRRNVEAAGLPIAERRRR